MKKIGMCCDHAGYAMKERLKEYLVQEGYEISDFGTDSTESCDYADYAHPMASALENGDFAMGISLCGSGNGINMTSNKHQGVRAALCWNAEISMLARAHNDANVCSLPARYISFDEATEIVRQFFATEFEGGRHLARIRKIPLA